jgi:glycosyltransferase involved in cell wall biosynthesis
MSSPLRLAWFTPWPPDPSGIAGRSAELVPALAAAGHAIDVCVDRPTTDLPKHADGPPAPGDVRVQSAHDVVWRTARDQYDLAVYQVGNSRLHRYMWPYLFRWPGLTVLHDARLHHARAAIRLGAGRADRYRADFARNHPDEAPGAAELAVRGFDGSYYYLWPMVRDLVDASRTTAVHAIGAAADLAGQFPGRPIEYVTLGEGVSTVPTDAERHATRRRLGLPDDAVVYGVCGGLTREKRIPEILQAFRAAVGREPTARLLLAGHASPSLDWRSLSRRLGIDHAVLFAGTLDDDTFDRVIAAVDVSLNLRWPTALETSGPWLRALSAARATVVMDLAHQAHVPALDPRTWQPTLPREAGEPVTVAVDVLDEVHSLTLALRRLATDEPLRGRLGRAGRAYWLEHHTFERMRQDYLSLLERAASRPPYPVSSAMRLEYDPESFARSLVADFGDRACALF